MITAAFPPRRVFNKRAMPPSHFSIDRTRYSLCGEAGRVPLSSPRRQANPPAISLPALNPASRSEVQVGGVNLSLTVFSAGSVHKDVRLDWCHCQCRRVTSEYRSLTWADGRCEILLSISITPSDALRIEGVAMPISSIAIEIFTPAPGGAFVNERFSPLSFVVTNMRDYTAPASGPASD